MIVLTNAYNAVKYSDDEVVLYTLVGTLIIVIAMALIMWICRR